MTREILPVIFKIVDSGPKISDQYFFLLPSNLVEDGGGGQWRPTKRS